MSLMILLFSLTLQLLASCCQGVDNTYNGAFGVFTSANFPKTYENDADDTFTISVPKGFKIVLYFSSFNIEESYKGGVPCVNDYLEIIDGPLNSNSSMGKLCGDSSQGRSTAPLLRTQKFESTGNTLSLRMVSDWSNVLSNGQPEPNGFRAHYFKQDRNECAEQRKMKFSELEDDTTCKGYCNNYPGGYYCSCDPGYTLHADGRTCIGNCSPVDPDATFGVVTSPGYPNRYSAKTDCKWSIKAEAGKMVHLTFDSEFDLEDHQDGGCPYDFLKVTDYFGNRGTFCGNQVPMMGNEIVSTTNWLELEFHSDTSINGAGFQINYELKGTECKIPDAPKRGMIVHPENPTKQQTVPFGDYILFKCEVGYRLFGSHKTVCLKDGSLSDKTPICVGF